MKNDGILGEAKVMAYFLERNYDVFNQFGGKAPFDLIVHKDGIISRVQVKSTSYERNGGYDVNLQRVRPNRTGNTIHKFNNNDCDVLAVYIIPEDRIIVYDSKTITATSQLRIRKLAESG